MTHSQPINISINSADLQNFCLNLIKCSQNISKTHNALITLETFISTFSQSSHGTQEYQVIESTIKTITDQSRHTLLEKSTEDLIKALSQCNIIALTATHSSLSRNGFYQILQTTISQLSDDDIRLVMLWSANWIKEAKQLAQKASGYPDAMNFLKAGIRIEEFQAMSDIDRVLNPSEPEQ